MLKITKAKEQDLINIIHIEKNKNIYKDIKNKNLDFWVLNKNGLIIGYIIYLIIKSDNFIEVELHNIAVSKEYQREGFASMMLEHMITSSRQKSKNSNFFLEVRESNFKAINLYKKQGFTQQGVRKNYYSNPIENALLFLLKK